jgi:protein tyrosine phosphatase (PTP) superfamily phosphohydrolase (DUF442 family)
MNEPSHILNWRRIEENLTTSGQPSVSELAELQSMGVTHIINLAPHDNDGALPDEPRSVKALGMVYVYIPVDFDDPKEVDFEVFRTALEALEGKKVHVHCIYNARVSAFFFRLATEGGKLSMEAAYSNMESIWRPGQDWADFVRNPDAKGQMNRYAGEDY